MEDSVWKDPNNPEPQKDSRTGGGFLVGDGRAGGCR